MFVPDIVDEVTLCTNVMNAYRFVVDLRENILRAGQEKITCSTPEIIGSDSHSIRQVMVAEDVRS